MSREPTHAQGPEVTEEGIPLATSIVALSHRIMRRFSDQLESVGLNPRQYRLLALVGTSSGISQAEAAGSLHIPPSGMVVLVDELEAMCLLSRKPHAHDRRTHVLALSDQGRRKLRQAAPIADHLDDQVLSSLSPRERQVLARLLTRVAADNCGFS